MRATRTEIAAIGNNHHTALRCTILLLALSSLCQADILNMGFELSRPVTPWPDTIPLFWRLGQTDYTVFGSRVIDLWQTEGSYSAALFSRFGRSVTAGDSQSIYQAVDLTPIAGIVFDVRLAAYGSNILTQFESFEAAFLVDGVPLWTQTADGIYLDQEVNVAHLSGVHRIELRSMATDNGQFDVAYWVQWDNLRAIKMPVETVIEASVNVDPDTLNLRSKGKWVTCRIELPDPYSVDDIDGCTVTLEGVAAYMGREGWATPEANAGNTMDSDGDGVMERMVKFDRSAVQAVLEAGEVTVTVKGKLTTGAITFKGVDALKVIDKKGGTKD